MFYNKNKIIFLSLFLLTFCISIPNVFAAECVDYKSGAGTVEDPYRITTNEELYSITCNLDSHFILENDLNLLDDTTKTNGLFYNDGNGWISIGGVFSGSLDGNNKTISGLTQHRVLETSSVNGLNYGGLFVNVSGIVKNLKLKDININYLEKTNVGVRIGGIAANASGKILNSTVTGNIIYNGEMGNLSAYSPYSISGIVGDAINNLEIDNCVNEANITIDSSIGGDVGGITSRLDGVGLINSCINRGNITTNDQGAGGIARALGDENSIIKNCKNYGTITADYAGGIVGTLTDGKVYLSANFGNVNARVLGGGIVSLSIMNSVVEKSYNAGTVNTFESITDGTPGAGGIAGTSYGTIKDCYNIGIINDEKGVNLRPASIGGIVGTATGTVTNTYSIGTIKSTNKNTTIGNIVGTNNASLTNSYYLDNGLPGVGILNDETLNASGIDNSVELTAIQLRNSESYNGFDFNNVWNTNKNTTYPLPQINNNDLEGTYIKSINLIYNNKVYIGEKIKINYELTPNDTSFKNVIWSVINGTGEGTITEDGEFVGTKTGTVTIVATAEEFPVVTGELEIDVLPVPIEKIEINEDIEQVSLNNEYTFTTTATPSNTTNKNVIWSVINGTGEGTITEDGKFVGTKTGTVTIVATADDNSEIKDSIEIEIIGVDVERISIKADSLYVNTGTSFYLKAYVVPTNASVKDIVWSSSDTSIATIDPSTGGVATKYKSGMVTFTATSSINNEIKDTITIYVGYTSIKIGETTSLGNSSYITYDEVIWEIEDENILEATGKQGSTSVNSYYKHYIYVKGKANGVTTVTMKTISGDVLAQSKVYVYTPITKIESVYDSIETDVDLNHSTTAGVTLNTSDISKPLDELIYISGDDSIASIDENGMITGKKKGKTNIYVYSKYYNVSLTIPVDVVIYTSNLTLNEYEVSLNPSKLTHQIEYSISPDNTSFKKVTFKSENEKIATVNEDGLITAIRNGSTKIIVTTEDGRHTKEIEVTISGIRKEINNLQISNIVNQTYTSQEIKPLVTIIDGDYELINNTDYTIEYKNNINAGTATVIITGINDYYGTKEINFIIDKAEPLIEFTSDDKIVTFDDNYHGISINVISPDNVIIKYADKNGNYTLTEMPKYKEAGTYIIKYQLSINDNYNTITNQNTVIIHKKDSIDVELENYQGLYDGNEHTFELDIKESNYDIKYSTDGKNYTITEKPKYKEAGDYSINIKITSNNFEDYYTMARVQIFGITGFDNSLKLNNNLLIIKNYQNVFSSLYNRIKFYALKSDWKHLNSSKTIIDNENIKTGDFVQLILNDKKTYEYQLSVLGDVNGDGKISALDYVRIKNHIMQTTKIKDNVFLTAADVNDDGKISALDYVRIKNYIMNGGK